MPVNATIAPLPDQPLVSCLCVTEDRAAFMPWLLWGFDRQDWHRRQLVVVDSSIGPLDLPARPDVRVVTVPRGTAIARKRNVALEAAAGDLVVWFDDDDWQHPHKLTWLVAALRGGKAFAGSQAAWFVDPGKAACTTYRGRKHSVIFNSAGFRTDAVRAVAFREDVPKASDTHWMRAVAARYPEFAVVDRDDLFFWLSHARNVSNPVSSKRFPHGLDVLRSRVGTAAWGDTDDQLAALQSRLDGSAGGAPAAVPSGLVPPAVGVMIKATVLDAPFLDVMVRHMIAQARYPFAERAIVVDRPRAFTGKYFARPRASDAELERVLETLLDDGVIDCVRHVDDRPETIARVMGRYFGERAAECPTHASTGGPIYSTLFGLESMTTDVVLQMDADVLFHTGPASWVARALQCMAADPSLWLMMTHPGPPFGIAGRSLGGPNSQRGAWDPGLRVWRFRHATTRYCLCDRRLLRGRLPAVRDARGFAPLEQCIGKALQQNGAFRGNLGDLQSWHLHVWHHGDPFPAWASSLAAAVAAGNVPALQRGSYDLRLDRALDRRAWQQTIERGDPPRIEVVRRSANPPDVTHLSPPPGVSPIAVVIPVRDRAGQRLRNTLRSLQWQSAGPPADVVVVSHGSRPEIDRELETLCSDEGARLIALSRPSEPWNKSVALNTGIRRASTATEFLMTMDADMVLAPDLLSVVIERLRKQPPALVLCRISDLPPQADLPGDRDALRHAFDRLRSLTSLRARFGSGGIQAASRAFFFTIRGYDEDLAWWGAMDGDILNRARLMGLDLDWVENRTAMLHQWHPRKHAALNRPEQIIAAKRAWRANHALVRSRRNLLQRNPRTWGGVTDDAAVAVRRVAR